MSCLSTGPVSALSPGRATVGREVSVNGRVPGPLGSDLSYCPWVVCAVLLGVSEQEGAAGPAGGVRQGSGHPGDSGPEAGGRSSTYTGDKQVGEYYSREKA